MLVLANIFSFIGISFLAYSTFSNRKNNMLYIQVADTLFNAISNLLIGSYSGMLSNLIGTVRNILIAKGKMSKKIYIFLSLVLLVIGVFFNKLGLIGILPIIATIEYTILSSICKDAQELRYALIINILIWLIHDIYVRLYPAFIMDIVIIVITSMNCIKYKGKE